MHQQLRSGCLAAAVLLAFAATAQHSPWCMPANSELCGVMSSADFVNAYRKAYEVKFTPRDTVQDIRRSLRHAAAGSGHASPAALGQQVELALDSALDRMKGQLCNGSYGGAKGDSAAAAGGFAAAGRSLGLSLAPELLGGMTGSFLRSLEPRDSRCLCNAVDFKSIPAVCAS